MWNIEEKRQIKCMKRKESGKGRNVEAGHKQPTQATIEVRYIRQQESEHHRRTFEIIDRIAPQTKSRSTQTQMTKRTSKAPVKSKVALVLDINLAPVVVLVMPAPAADFLAATTDIRPRRALDAV